MGVSAYLLVVLCMLCVAAGMAQPSPEPQPKRPPLGHAMSMAIVVAIGVVFFLVFLYCYITQFRFRLAEDGSTHAGNAAASRHGLDPAVLATFPIVPYAEIREHKIGGGALECAVCLTAFEEADDLRLLPHCSHAFHPECIDPWLQARTTCPLCRANLEKPHAAVAIAMPLQDKEQDEEDRGDDDGWKEEAVELENLRGERREARLRRSRSTGHSLVSGPLAEEQCVCDDHERYTLRLPERVREQVLSRCCARPAAAESLRGGRCVGGSFRDAGGDGADCRRGRRRWVAFMPWARGGGGRATMTASTPAAPPEPRRSV